MNNMQKTTVTLYCTIIVLVLIAGCGGSSSGSFPVTTPTAEQSIPDTDGKEVVADGVSAIENGDLAKARGDAIKDAQRLAVEQVIGTLINAETFTKNFQMIEEKILTKSEGYAKLKEVLDEKQEGMLYKVKIIAIVYTETLKKDLSALFVNFPRVMTVISETDLGAKANPPASETEIIKRCLQQGFKVLDQNQVNAIRDNNSVSVAIDGDINSAVLLGKKFEVDVIILGVAFSEENPSGSMGGLMSARARVEAKAIRVDNSEIIAVDGKIAGAVDATLSSASKKALQNAGGLIADYLIEQIIAKWTSDNSSGTRITITMNISGDTKFIKYKEFKETLSSLQGFLSIDERAFDADIGTGQLDAYFQGKTEQDIANTLDGAKTSSGFKVSIIKVTANNIELSIE